MGQTGQDGVVEAVAANFAKRNGKKSICERNQSINSHLFGSVFIMFPSTRWRGGGRIGNLRVRIQLLFESEFEEETLNRFQVSFSSNKMLLHVSCGPILRLILFCKLEQAGSIKWDHCQPEQYCSPAGLHDLIELWS